MPLPVLALLALAPTSLAASDDWPGWRGPGGSGVAEGSPPIEWTELENVRWKAEVPGKGTSCPVVVGDLVLITTAVGTGNKAAESEPEEGAGETGRPGGDRGGRGGSGRGRGGFGGGRGRSGPLEEQSFHVLALDRAGGEIVWNTKVHTQMPHQGTHGDGSFASPTLVTDGAHVFASFGSFGIYALDMAGEVVWEKDLGDMSINNSFGEGSSPILVGDLLIQNWDHQGDSFLVALDKVSGEERWRTERPGGTSWSTPLLVETDQGAQVVIAGSRTIAYSAATGAEVWSQGEAASGRSGGVITSPVVGDGLVILSTGSRGGELRALRPLLGGSTSSKGDAAAAEDPLVWVQDADTPHIPSPIAYLGRLFVLKQNSGILTAFDLATGEPVYGPERMEGLANAYASPVAAGGHIYFAGRDGTVEVVAVEGNTIETVAVNQLEDSFDASPAIAGNELYLRGARHVYCIAEE